MGAPDFVNLPNIGASIRRKEDYRFLTGGGQYTDDINIVNQTYAVFVRSPHAHARIKSVDTRAAKAAPGVVGVLVGQDVADAKINGLPCGWLITSTDGSPMKEPPHPILALDKVRYVGDHVAMVVAETLDQAKNAAELVEVDYDVLKRGGQRDCRRQSRSAARRSTRQPLLQMGAWRQGAGGRCVCQCRAYYKVRFDQQPLDSKRDGTTRRDWPLQPCHRRLHAVCVKPEPPRRTALAHCVCDGLA